MSLLWTGFVELLEAGIFVLSQFFGGQLGSAILVFTLLVRLALLPLTYFVAKRARRHQAALAKLKPQLERIQKRYADNPRLMIEKTRAVFQRNGVRQIEPASLLGMLPQLPLFAGLFQALRKVAARGGSFLWIDNLARPDLLLALGVSGLVGLGMLAGGSSEHGIRPILLIPLTAITGIVLLRTSAAFGLYMGINSAIGVAQSRFLLRNERRSADRA